MTTKELHAGLSALGYPVAYSHFSEGNMPDPPYITYTYQGTENFSADGIVYHPVEDVDIELYSVGKNEEAEEKISGFLKESGIFYEKQEYYIESEKLVQVIFEITLI